MLICVAYHAGDLEQAERLEDRMRELGPYHGHSILVARDNSADKQLFRDCGFDSWKELVITNDVWKKWCESPNNAFRQVAVFIEYTKPEPWLWLEPDVALIRKGWDVAIAASYKEALSQRKVFLGAFVPGFAVEQDGKPMRVPDHMSGIGVYPGEIKRYAGKATLALESPFDIEGAEQILPLMHRTNLIQHNWRRPSFTSLEELESELDPAVVIYHSDKTGSITQLLRAKELSRVGREVAKPSSDGDVAVHSNENTEPLPEVPSGDRAGSNPALPSNLPPVEEWSGHDNDPMIDEHGRFKKNLGRVRRAEDEPWANLAKTKQQIRFLCKELEAFCDGSRHTRTVRQELHNYGIVKLPGYRKKRRRK